MKSAPRPTAISASSHRVMPQTFIRTAIDRLSFAPSRIADSDPRVRERGTKRLQLMARTAAAQQALADEKGARARAVEPADILGRVDSAFRDHQRRTAIAVEQALGDRDIGDESMQVAIVDTDDFGAGASRKAQFAFVMDFNQCLKAK